jgi:hypothetical protein
LGAQDKAPRKPRTRIIEEPPTPPPTPEPEPGRPKAKARVAKEPPAVAPEPRELSPRSLFKAASAHIAMLQTEREQARRNYWSETIARSLR